MGKSVVFVAVVMVSLGAGCADRTSTVDDDGAGDDGGSEAADDDDDGASGNASDDDGTSSNASDDDGMDVCTGFAAGSLSDASFVPNVIDTAFGLTVEFRGVEGEVLDVVFTCTSNGEVLSDDPVMSATGFSMDVATADGPWTVALTWVPGDDIDFSVAVAPG
jgi:hypothetical protein